MPEQPEAVLTATPRPKKKGGGFKFMFVVLVILALGGVIVYLLSLMNSKMFFLEQADGKLYVKQGVLFVTGSEPYNPPEPTDAWLYEPIDAPEDYKNAAPRQFGDLASLHQEFGRILIKQAQELVFAADDAKYNLGKAHLKRLRALPGLTGQQHDLVKALRADLDYIEAKRAYLGLEKILEAARSKFVEAKTYGTGRFSDAGKWIDKIDSLLVSIRATKAGKLPPSVEIPAPAPGTETKAKTKTVEPIPPPTADDSGEASVVTPSLAPRRNEGI